MHSTNESVSVRNNALNSCFISFLLLSLHSRMMQLSHIYCVWMKKDSLFCIYANAEVFSNQISHHILANTCKTQPFKWIGNGNSDYDCRQNENHEITMNTNRFLNTRHKRNAYFMHVFCDRYTNALIKFL